MLTPAAREFSPGNQQFALLRVIASKKQGTPGQLPTVGKPNTDSTLHAHVAPGDARPNAAEVPVPVGSGPTARRPDCSASCAPPTASRRPRAAWCSRRIAAGPDQPGFASMPPKASTPAAWRPAHHAPARSRPSPNSAASKRVAGHLAGPASREKPAGPRRPGRRAPSCWPSTSNWRRARGTACQNPAHRPARRPRLLEASPPRRRRTGTRPPGWRRRRAPSGASSPATVAARRRAPKSACGAQPGHIRPPRCRWRPSSPPVRWSGPTLQAASPGAPATGRAPPGLRHRDAPRQPGVALAAYRAGFERAPFGPGPRPPSRRAFKAGQGAEGVSLIETWLAASRTTARSPALAEGQPAPRPPARRPGGL